MDHLDQDSAARPRCPPASRTARAAARAPRHTRRDGTLLHLRARSFVELIQRLPAEELGEVLLRWHRRAVAEIQHQGGEVVRSTGDSILAYFDRAGGPDRDSAQRALNSGFALIRAARTYRNHLERNFDASLGAWFAISVMLHHGPVTVRRRTRDPASAVEVSGETVETLDALRQRADEWDWTFSVTLAAVRFAGDRLTYGRIHRVRRGRRGAEAIIEVIGPDPAQTVFTGLFQGANLAHLIRDNDAAGTRLAPRPVLRA